MDNKRPTWAEIDLGAVRHNLRCIREAAGKAQIMAVVKANAYGHGMLEICKVCLQEKVEYFGVASLDEALTMRSSGIKNPVLVLGYIPPCYAEVVVKNNISSTVFNLEAARALSAAAVRLGSKARIHLKIDTGMGRLGFFPDEDGLALVKEIACLPGVELEGVFTHLATADTEDKAFAYEQLDKFNRFIKKIEEEGIKIPWQHCSNSAALIDIPEARFNMVRAGITLYGLYPSREVKRDRLKIIPAMRLKSRIVFLKVLPPGYTVSYGRTYRCTSPTKVATVPIGYADGYSRLLSNKAWAVVRGVKVPLIGTVCMDQCMFDVTGVEGVKEGDEVILFGREEDGVTADDLAAIIGTINYEIVSCIGPRVPRVYIAG
ncbi:alanine racemase [Thermosyntropha lipolytica DSM 11003]|uniref:Alanine racemase n=1 Tax=Thermosyntropha lipolytica DSM 11003 TaxID=1123382 RepID=A0A1M5JFC5_9FIRM|nr:alanine racemase [Thermosyntropha lipolytica]SHG39282.1 alanine racemase [Thermosyntropha lipolytica DSM 11003]